jgi:hypothetical protein
MAGFKSKANTIPQTILYFISLIPKQMRKTYLFTKWLVKIMCEQYGEYCLSFLPHQSQTIQSNLNYIFQSFNSDNEFSEIIDT